MARARARAKKFGSGKFTASQTGARQDALERNADRVTIIEYANRSGAAQTPKGATPQFAPPESEDIERMINPGYKRKGGR